MTRSWKAGLKKWWRSGVQRRAKRRIQRFSQLGLIGDAAYDETIPKTLAQQFTVVTGNYDETPGAQTAMIGGPQRCSQNRL